MATRFKVARWECGLMRCEGWGLGVGKCSGLRRVAKTDMHVDVFKYVR